MPELERVAVSPSKRRDKWNKARPTGGLVRDVNWNVVVAMLKDAGMVDSDEFVERIEMDQSGLHVYISER